MSSAVLVQTNGFGSSFQFLIHCADVVLQGDDAAGGRRGG